MITTTDTYTVSPTLLVRLTRGKLLRFLCEELMERGIPDTFTCAIPGDYPLSLYLDVWQIARVSHELVTLLQTWKCPLQWGCRVDGPAAPKDGDPFLPALFQVLEDDIWWPAHHYLVSTRLPESLHRQLQKAGIPCILHLDCPEDPFVAQLAKSWAEPPLLQPEYVVLSPMASDLPLAWSPDSHRLLYTRQQQYITLPRRQGSTSAREWRDALLFVNRKKRKVEALVSFVWLGSRGGCDEAHMDLSGCAWSPDGKLFAFAFCNETLVLRVRGHRPLLTIPEAECHATELAWSPDSQKLALSCSTEDDPDVGDNALNIQIWDMKKQERILTYKGHNEPTREDIVRCLAWSPDGTQLASAGTDSSVHVWNTTSGERLVQYLGHTDRVTTVSFHPEGELIASTSYDGSLQVWSSRTGALVLTEIIISPVVFHGWLHERRVAWTPDGALIFQNGEGQLVHLYPSTGLRATLLELSPYVVQDVVCSPDGKFLALHLQDFTKWEEDDECLVIWSLDNLRSQWL